MYRLVLEKSLATMQSKATELFNRSRRIPKDPLSVVEELSNAPDVHIKNDVVIAASPLIRSKLLSAEELTKRNYPADKSASIAVLISGGVDSAVSLLLLRLLGYTNITAFYIKIWLEDDGNDGWLL
jgi:predicted PP-loop superfamily ATPase